MYAQNQEITPLQRIQTIMQDFTTLSSVATSFIDVKGNHVIPVHGSSLFCQQMQQHDTCEECKQCRALIGIESLKKGTTAYRCHAGLVLFSIPVIHESTLLGFIIAGQLRLKDNNIPYITTKNTQLSNMASYQKIPFSNEKMVYSAIKVLESMVQRHFPNSNSASVLHPIPSEEKGGYREEIQNAIDFMEESLESSVTLNDICNHVYLSKSYFCKLFKQEVGISFHQFFITRRIKKAKELLEGTDLPVTTISKKVGFSTPSHFCRIFKEIEMETPYNYRRKLI